MELKRCRRHRRPRETKVDHMSHLYSKWKSGAAVTDPVMGVVNNINLLETESNIVK